MTARPAGVEREPLELHTGGTLPRQFQWTTDYEAEIVGGVKDGQNETWRLDAEPFPLSEEIP